MNYLERIQKLDSLKKEIEKLNNFEPSSEDLQLVTDLLNARLFEGINVSEWEKGCRYTFGLNKNLTVKDTFPTAYTHVQRYIILEADLQVPWIAVDFKKNHIVIGSPAVDFYYIDIVDLVRWSQCGPKSAVVI